MQKYLQIATIKDIFVIKKLILKTLIGELASRTEKVRILQGGTEKLKSLFIKYIFT